MSDTASPGAAGRRTGSASLGGGNSSELRTLGVEEQANEERLALMRGSAFRIGNNAAAQLELTLGSLEVEDDFAVTHHTRKVVNCVKALAKVVNEITALHSGGAA